MKALLKVLLWIVLTFIVLVFINWAVGATVALIGNNDISKSGEYIEIDDSNIYYEKSGEGDPLVLIHGFLGSIENFRSIIPELEKEYTVYAIDLPGFGRSSKDTDQDFSKENMAKLVKEMMNSLGINKFDVLGHSMGGEVALNLAYYYSSSIRNLILVDSAGYAENEQLPPWISDNSLLSVPLLRLGFQTLPMQWTLARMAFYDKSFMKFGTFMRDYSLVFNIPSKTLHEINIQDDSGSLEGVIKDIETRTLIIWGEEDEIISIEDAFRFSQELRNSSLTVIDDSGHIPFIENPVEFINSLKDFLK